MKKAIAMICNQEQFDNIASKVKHTSVYGFDNCPYLTNDWINSKIVSNISNDYVKEYSESFEIHETWSEEIFLKACGIEPNYKITKETILKYDMREEFPDLFEVKLVEGKWYRVKTKISDYLLLYSENKKEFYCGFMNGEWDDSWLCSKSYNQKLAKEATSQEVEEALKSELTRLGFGKKGVWFVDVNGKKMKSTIDGFDFWNITSKTTEEENRFNVSVCNTSGVVYRNGKFGKIIETITKSEAEKLLNKKII